MSANNSFLRVSVTVDAVAFTIVNGELSVLCPKRTAPPHKGRKALPGGFLLPDERLSQALVRVIRSKTELGQFHYEQLHTFDELARDPRERVVSVAYLIVLPSVGNSDDSDWIPVANLGALAFDHNQIVEHGLARLRAKMAYTNMGLYFLAHSFTLTEAQQVFETVLGSEIEKRNFRKQLMERGLVEDTGEMTQGGAHRPAKLYRMKHRALFYWD